MSESASRDGALSFATVGVIGRLGHALVADTLVRLVALLERRGVRTIVETPTADMMPARRLETAERERLGELCDLVIVVGGDGSLLGASRDLVDAGVPVLGINRGSLGFLADIGPDEAERRVGEVLDGQYLVEHHFMLDAAVRRGQAIVGASTALNDVVVHAGTMARMMEFQLSVDGEFVYEQRSDGLIVSTPTGSTAYALSAGGPIMHPRLDAICIVPMFPHTLTSRPLVVQGDCEIGVELGDYCPEHPQVSCDSQVDLEVRPGDQVIIRKKPKTLALLHPLEHSFYESCRSKLDWGSRLGDKRNDGDG